MAGPDRRGATLRDGVDSPNGAASDSAPQTALQLLVARTESDARTLRDVAETLSHELRTPLTTIYSGSKLLSRHSAPLSDALVREVSAAMEADAERLLRVVEDLVVAAALPGEPAIPGEPVLLQRLLPAVARAAQRRWPAVTVAVVLADQLPAVRADGPAVAQVVRNLIDNAAQYGPPAGRIVLRGAAVGDRIEIHVLDEGPGIDVSEIERVFRLFARSRAGSHAGGLGPGLFVSRRLVELMGGHLWVAQRESGGSDFGFDLRAYPADER